MYGTSGFATNMDFIGLANFEEILFHDLLFQRSMLAAFIRPKGRIPVLPWMNVNLPEGLRARLEIWKGDTGLAVGFPQ